MDLTPVLRRVGERNADGLRVARGRGDEVASGGGIDQRTLDRGAVGHRAKEDYNPDLRFDREPEAIKVTPRNFR